MPYGKELVMDLHDCNPDLFTKERLIQYFEELAELTGMELQTRHWWTMEDCPEEWKKIPHLYGISCVQFISTSNFTIHAMFDGRLYVNLFTCKDFLPADAIRLTQKSFEGTVVKVSVLVRE